MKKIFAFLAVLIFFHLFTVSVWGEFFVVPVAGDRIKGTISCLWISGNGVTSSVDFCFKDKWREGQSYNQISA